MATESRNGVFTSQPALDYRFIPLLRIAQIAPVRVLATGDFDGDGHTDAHTVEPGQPDVAYTHPARNEVSS